MNVYNQYDADFGDMELSNRFVSRTTLITEYSLSDELYIPSVNASPATPA